MLSLSKVKLLSQNIWYQLWKHPECQFKSDLVNVGGEAERAYLAVEDMFQECPFCEFDLNISNEIYGNSYKNYEPCSHCPLHDKVNFCCDGVYQKWAYEDDPVQRSLYAKRIYEMICKVTI